MGEAELNDVVQLLFDKGSRDQRLDWYTRLRDRLDAEIGGDLGSNVREIELRGGAQSRAFMISLLPKIWEHLLRHPRGTSLSVLDVGPGAAFGSELLASIHEGPFLGYKLFVSVLDIRDTYFELIKYRHPGVRECIKKDIFELNQAYDIVICSHVIEHVSDPVAFVRQLQRTARHKVFLLTPWKEDETRITKGHINIFDESFVTTFEDLEWELMESIAWGAFLDPRYKMLYMALPGLADSAQP